MSTPLLAPRLPVRPPPAPVGHRFGLFSAATVLEDAEPHALGGVSYEAVCSAKVDPYPVACDPTVPAGPTGPKLASRSVTVSVGTPFGLYAADSCMLGRDATQARDQLRARFTAGEQTAAERVVFSGVLGNVPNLHAADVLPSTVAPDLDDAIGLLETWLSATYGGVGVIHAPRWFQPHAVFQAQVVVNGPRASTVMGSAWVFGTGYPGTPPAGESADTALWLYASPPVTVRRSVLLEPADFNSGAVDRETNTALLITERIYVVDWPCQAVAAVKTNLTRPGVV